MKGNIVVDSAKCISCHSCEIACAVEHSRSKDLFQAIGEHPRPQKRIIVECYGESNLPLQCRHCEEAPCVRICPTGALIKEGVEGAVVLQDNLCIGCKWCVLVCPFGVITAAPDDHSMIKCDLCPDRAAAGRLPACVESCPTGALQLSSTAQLARTKRREFLVEYLREQ
ncbi:MAG: 4Fe-4S dicluster domain-containing protein [Firmicutes bacterium]|nr:4Fe-4S dicluster domain-containing protein [Bacillota bacterium]